LFLNFKSIKSGKIDKEIKNQNEMEPRRKDLLNLKETIDNNCEIYEARVNKLKYQQAKNREKINEEKRIISERGENPNFYLPRKMKMEEQQRLKTKFDNQQFNNTQEIVKKILKENDNLEKKKKLYPNLFNINKNGSNQTLKPINHETGRTKILSKIASKLDIENSQIGNATNSSSNFFQGSLNDNEDRKSFYDNTTVTSKEEDSDIDELNEHEEILIEPEFEGLWDKKTTAKYDAETFYKHQKKFPPCYKTKAEKELYLKTLENLKKSSVKDQVAAGRKFVGISFKSQPKIIEFKNFIVGEIYKLKIVLTNISYTINTCKLTDLSECLKDFIDIEFKSPGQLSAGLTCDFFVTFKPKINKDIEGTVEFLSTNGPFSIPIKCSIKKCDLSVNTQFISFGANVINEKSTRKLQLINNGALGTNFKVLLNGETPNETEGIVMKKIENSFIDPMSNLEFEYSFVSSFPGEFKNNYFFTFEDENSKDIKVEVKATAIDVPIWIEKVDIDLKICMYDRLYQDVICVHNRANTALRIIFEIPHELRNHLEILPKTAFVQAKSEFQAQLKFIARTTLESDAQQFFDPVTGVLEVPLFIRVPDQINVINYNLNAIVTTSDLEFNLKTIDFGCCTIYEAATATVSLTNKSILCQPFGFIKLPDYVNVQPNDGFGTLLPKETIEIDINFCPNTAKEYKFSVICKSLVNRDFVIDCCGVGVHPPLKLSAQRINFKATSIGTTTSEPIYVINDHLDYDQHRHPVPRIGNGDIAPVGPTFFEFDLPDNCPFKLSPQVGVVNPGERIKVVLQYTAKLKDSHIKKEAALILKNKIIEKKRQTEHSQSSNKTTSDERSKSKKTANSTTTTTTAAANTSKNKNKTEINNSTLQVDNNRPQTPDLASIKIDSAEYYAGLSSAIQKYEGEIEYFKIACYVASQKVGINDQSDISNDDNKTISYSSHNTLYLDVICPSVRPELIIVTEEFINCRIDFGKCSVGQKIIKKISIKNITKSVINLGSNILSTNDDFVMLNSLRDNLKPNCVHNILLAFIPTKSRIYYETLEIKTDKSMLSIILNGVGVEPAFSLSLEGNQLDFGYCLVNERIEKTIELKNNSKIPLEYQINLSSLLKNDENNVELNSDQVLTLSKPKVGPRNFSGQNVFDVNPIQGSIEAGNKVSLKLTFSPDHSSDLFSDVVKISLLSCETKSRDIQLVGKSRNKAMYIRGVEYLSTNCINESMMLGKDIETLSLDNQDNNQNDSISSPVKGGTSTKEKLSSTKEDKNDQSNNLIIPTPVLLTLYAAPSTKTIGEYTQAEKLIHIGCMKQTMNLADKKDTKKVFIFYFFYLK
jgi:hypothetical protein